MQGRPSGPENAFSFSEHNHYSQLMETPTQQLNSELDKKVFNYACGLLARRRYGTGEFREKLEKKFPDQTEAITRIIDLFLTKKYLDDSEYTRLYIHEQLRRKPQGLRMIKQKLRQKGINESTISSVFQEQIIDEDALIKQAAQKKAHYLKVGLSPLQRKQKLFRFLASRGFNPDNIMKTLSNLEKEEI